MRARKRKYNDDLWIGGMIYSTAAADAAAHSFIRWIMVNLGKPTI